MGTVLGFSRSVSAPPPLERKLSRRGLLRAGAAGLAALALGPRAAAALAPAPRRLRLLHTHTGERLDVVYAEGGARLPDALAALDRLLRDHRTGAVHPIDPDVLDTTWALAGLLGRSGAEIQIISGYRSPHTNESLRARGGGGVARHSLHLDGRAIDLRLPGVGTRSVRDAALRLARGGVGYYPASDFVHVDSGRFRTW